VVGEVDAAWCLVVASSYNIDAAWRRGGAAAGAATGAAWGLAGAAAGGRRSRRAERPAERGAGPRDHTVVDTQPAGFDVHCMKHSHNKWICY
jgi:hypothetical protein